MYVQNYSNVNLPLNIKGHSYVLLADAVSFIPDGVVTIDKLKVMFGENNIGLAEGADKKCLLKTQQRVEANKVYMIEHDPEGDYPRLYVGEEGTVSVYGSDSETLPVAFTEMNLPSENTDVTGLLLFGMLPKYVAFEITDGTPEILVNNCKLTEVGEIA